MSILDKEFKNTPYDFFTNKADIFQGIEVSTFPFLLDLAT